MSSISLWASSHSHRYQGRAASLVDTRPRSARYISSQAVLILRAVPNFSETAVGELHGWLRTQ